MRFHETMKNTRTIVFITILLCAAVLLLTILDFAALHDIKHDYVSSFMLNHLKTKLSDDLPEWTEARGEWRLVSLSLYLRFLFLVLNMFVLVRFFRKPAPNVIKKKEP